MKKIVLPPVFACLLFLSCPNQGLLDNKLPRSVSFTDIDQGTGEIAGTATIDRALDESELTAYVLSWGSAEDEKLSGADPIEVFPKSGSLSYTFPPDTPIPLGATHLIATIRNDTEESAIPPGPVIIP